MSEGVWIAIIATVGVISTPLSGVLIAIVAKQGKVVRKVRDQVENSHVDPISGEPYNLRDNIDDNQNEVLVELKELRGELKGVRRDVGRVDSRTLEVERDVRSITRTLADHTTDEAGRTTLIQGRIEDLEDTLNVRKKHGHTDEA